MRQTLQTFWLLLLLALPGFAQQGKDGAGTITAAGTTVNAYTNLTANAAAGTTTLSVANSALTGGAFGTNALATGDLVMLIQHQGASITTATDATYGAVSAYNNAGFYELAEVRSVPNGTSIVVACALQKSYTATGKVQVVRVPRYTTLTLNANASITAPTWNGTTGGVVAVDVRGDVTLNTGATIDVSGKGFRGGGLSNSAGAVNGINSTAYVYASNASGAEKGESIAGYQTDYDALNGRFGRGAPANGGGGGNNHNAGGGGGANVSSLAWTGQGNPDATYNTAWALETPSLANTTSGGGGRGGYTYSASTNNPSTTAPGNAAWGGDTRLVRGGLGGRPLDLTGGRLFFGGGGGAGDENNNVGTPGGNGGGLIYLLSAGNLVQAAAGTSLLANGATVTATAGNDAPGGGGGGGTIVLNVAGSVPANITASANGGKGSSQNLAGPEAEGSGGGGGGGYIAYTSAPTTSVAGGANGTTNSSGVNGTGAFPPNGATLGSAGQTATFTYSQQCLVTADVQTLLDGPTSGVVGQALFFAAQTKNLSSDISATNVVPTITLPAGATNVVLPAGAYRTGNVVTFATIATLAPNQNVTNTVRYTLTTASTVTTAGANTSAQPDPVLANNNGSATGAMVTTAVVSSGAAGSPAPCATAGTNGALTTPTTATVLNTYYPAAVPTTLAAGATTVAVQAAVGTTKTNLVAGDLVLIVQMQGADINSTNTDSYGDGIAGAPANGLLSTNFTAGTYEYAKVLSVATSGTGTAANGGTLTLSQGLANGYSNAAATTTTGQRRFQVIRVPQYTDLTLAANVLPDTWSSVSGTGGVVALDVAGKLDFKTFAIDASGQGFRGGAGRKLNGATGLANTDYRSLASLAANGSKGGGIAGTPRFANSGTAVVDNTAEGYPDGSYGRGAPGTAGGGGNDGNPNGTAANDQNSGGGGGANGGAGGRGGNTWSSNLALGGEPGAPFGAASSSRLVMGGGGGAGSTNDGTGNTAKDGYASSGAAGGGLVLVRTGSVAGSGSILANGTSASNAVQFDGSGGGGAGGSILFTANNITGLNGITLKADGGDGGTNNPGANAHGPGGGGGGGIVLANGSVASASSSNGGRNGVTNSTTNAGAYGAESGQPGVINTRISNQVGNSTAGINCIADVATTLTAPATGSASQSVTVMATFSNNGGQAATASTASPIQRTVTFPANSVLAITSAPGGTISGTAATGFTVTYPGITTSLPAGSSSTFGITYTAPASGNVTATSTITPGTSGDVVTSNNTSSATTTIANTADVTTTLAGPTTVAAGQPTGTYTVTFSNVGNLPATQGANTQTVVLPVGATLPVLPTGATYDAATRTISFNPTATAATTTAAGNSVSYQFSFTAPTAAGSAALTSNTSSSTAQSPNNAPDQATLNLTVADNANVLTTITPPTGTVTAGQTGVSFTVNFSNNGPGTATNVARQVQLPAGLTVASVTGGGTYNATTGLVTFANLGTLASGASNNAVITFTAPATGPLAVTSSIGTDSNQAGQLADDMATAQIAIVRSFDVSTTIVGPTTSPVAGSLVTYSVMTANSATSVSPATNVVQTVQLLVGLTDVYVSNGGTYDKVSGVVTFTTLGSLLQGRTVNNTISYTAPATGTNLTAVATVTSDPGETNTANNTSTATAVATAPATAAQANVYTTISTPSANVAPGAAVTYTVVTGNSGPQSAGTVVQRVSLPAGLTNGSGTVTVSNGGTYDNTTGVVSFTALGSLGSGSTASNTITVQAPATGRLMAIASVSSATSDQVAADNTASVAVVVSPVTDITTTLEGPATATAGELVTYTLLTTNSGPAAATNVTQKVQIPANLTGLRLNGATGTLNTTTGLFAFPDNSTYDPASGTVTFPTIARQAASTTVTNTIAYNATAATSVTNVTNVATATPETVVTNNSASVTTTVQRASDVQVTLSGPANVVVGNPATYTVVTTNNGPSPAASQTTTVQLPTGLTSVMVSGGGVYDPATGQVTFPTQTNQPMGATGAVVNTITLNTPASASLLVSANAGVSPATNDPDLTNNAASVNSTTSAPTANEADIQTAIVSNVATQGAGQPVTFTVTMTNNGPQTATNAVQKVALPPGLTGLVLSNGSYDPATGIVTFPATSLASGVNQVFTITVNAPGVDPLTATAYASSNVSDPAAANNIATLSVGVTPSADVTTVVGGPATTLPNAPVTYSVVTLNNGPSVAQNVVQTVQLPAGLTGVTVSGGGVYDPGTGVVTFPTIAVQAPGAAGSVTNTISLTAPSTPYDVAGTVTTTTAETTTANNTSTLTTKAGNLAPVANAVVNRLQTPQSNTAGPLLLSPLSGVDPDGSVASYTITALPAAAPNGVSPGVLLLNGVPVVVGQLITLADASNLKFDPASGFTGNAFFMYTSTDNGGLTSQPALYTIPVGQDLNSTYARPTTTKGGNANKYVVGDVLAYGIDPNASRYNSAGFIYDPATGAAPSTGTGTVNNGIAVAKISPTDSTTLASYGILFTRSTGLFTVSNPAKLPRGGATLPAITVTSIDLNGGVNTNSVALVTGANPLPVELAAFTATAKNLDALLTWNTASEKSNDHFDVERSLNGTDFVTIAQVRGQGTSTRATDYALTDAGIGAKATGLVYYRLNQVDTDGTFSYSPVRSVRLGKVLPAAIALFPNPATTATNLDLTALPAGSYQVSVLDATGRVVLYTTLEAGQAHALQLNTIASGTYTVLVRGSNGGQVVNLTKRLVKE